MAEDLNLVDHALPADDTAGATITDVTGGRGCEASIDCSGSGVARVFALEHTRTWGRCAFVGEGGQALGRAEELAGPGIRFFRELSGDRGLMVVAGWCEKSTGERPYNSVVVIDRGVVVGCYRKTHLWGRETEVFAAGDQAPPVLATNLGLITPLICYDLEFPEVVRAAALCGAELIVAPSNWPRGLVPDGDRPIEVIKAQAAAAVNRVGVIVADRCGSERGQDWTGASLISGPDGYLLAGPAAGEETVLLADINLADCRDKGLGLYNDALADRRPHLYREPHR